MKAIGIMGTLAAMMGIDFAMLETRTKLKSSAARPLNLRHYKVEHGTIYRLTRKKPRDMSGRQWRKAKRLRRTA